MNLMLMQTHLLGVCNLAAQFLFMFVHEWRHWRRLTAWSLAHLAVVLSVLPWVLGYEKYERAIQWIPQPTLATLANTFFLVCPGSTLLVNDPFQAASMWIAALIAVLVAAFGLYTILRSPEERHTASMLLIWMLTPALLMFIASYVFVPSYVDRYALYAAFPTFILIGRGFAALPRPARYTLGALLIALYVVGIAQIKRPMRPDMATAADYIRFQSQESDLVIGRGMGYELCLDVYVRDVKREGIHQRSPLRRVVRDVQRGQRTWVVIDPGHREYARWLVPIDEAIADGSIAIDHDKTVPGPRPIRVFLLKPA